MKKISFLIPVYNEELNIENIYNKITEILKNLSYDINYEFVFTDNNSSDNTFQIIKQLNKLDPNVKGYSFQKNYGKEKSLFFAFKNCTGDAAIQLDCDFQDPPELISEFISKWNDGYEIVYGKRSKRTEGVTLNISRKIFYRLLGLISENKIELDVGDFGLIDKKVINQIKLHDKENIFLRGFIANLNYKKFYINYTRPNRIKGKSNFTLISYISETINAITFQTTSPLRFISLISLFISIISFFGILYYSLSKIFFPERSPDGFATQTVLIIIVLCFNSLFLSVIGEYISKMYQELVKKESVIVKEIVN